MKLTQSKQKINYNSYEDINISKFNPNNINQNYGNKQNLKKDKNRKEVTEIINAINTNMTNTLNLNNGNILLYQKQLQISNKNMEDINNNLKKLQINQAFNQSFGTFINQLTNTMNEKYDRLSNCMYNNQMNVQQMLIELKKEINNNNWSAKK
eukprot:155698_1